jgi:RHS repeat-associated protein
VKRSCIDALGRVSELDEEGSGGTGVKGSGAITITGPGEQSTTTPPTSSVGSFSISGNETYTYIPYCGPPACKIWNSGTVTIYINGRAYTATYAGCTQSDPGDASTGIALDLAAAVQHDPTAVVTASVSGTTINLRSKGTGLGVNYSLSSAAATTCSSYFQDSDYHEFPSGGNMTGGANAQLVYDSGSVSLTVNGVPASVNYGQNWSTQTVAANLAAAVTAKSSSSGVTASAPTCSSTVTLTATTVGAATNYSFAGSSTWDGQHFSQASFSVTPATGNLANGVDPNLGTNPPVTLYSFDVLDNLISVQQRGGTAVTTQWRNRTFTYDSLSRLACAANPEVQAVSCPPSATGTFPLGSVKYTYDANGNMSTKVMPQAGATSGTGVTTQSYTYDNVNRLRKITYTNPASATVQYGYDGTALSGCGVAPPSISSPTNRVGRRSSMCGGMSASSWSYDQMGRIVTDARTNKGSSSKTLTTSYSYNLDGSPSTISYPGGDWVHYTVGGAGRYVQADVKINSTLGTMMLASYTPDGSLAGGVEGPLATSNVYNSRLQPILLSALTSSQTPVVSLCYDFHLGRAINTAPCQFGAYASGDNGNVFQIYNNTSADATNHSVFQYDALNRLLQANSSATSGTNCWDEIYTIDAWGNLTNKTAPSGMGSCYTEQLNYPATAQNHLTGLSYDIAGNLLNDALGNPVTYDAENRIATDAGYTYSYDADGVRTERANGSVGTMYWPGAGGTLSETDLTGTINEEYIYFNGQRIARVDKPSGTAHYYYSDHLGSASVITDANANVTERYFYYPYGGVLYSSGSDSNRYKFTGKERDAESGLDYFGNRHYGSSFGRFMQADEPFNDQNTHDPQSWNLYTYVRNNPLRYTDPAGNACVQGSDGNWHNDNNGGESCEDVNKNNQNAQPSATVTATALPTELEYQAAYAQGMGMQNAMFLARFDAWARRANPIINSYLFVVPFLKFSVEEQAIADALEAEGNEVQALEVVQGQKNPDALVNGVKTEFKTVTVAGPNTLKNQIQDGLKQAPNVVVDARGTSMTKAQAMQQIQRVEGNMGSVQGRVTILTNEGTVKH